MRAARAVLVVTLLDGALFFGGVAAIADQARYRTDVFTCADGTTRERRYRPAVRMERSRGSNVNLTAICGSGNEPVGRRS